MSIALKMTFTILSVVCLIAFTFIVSFYHMFESNRESMDNYALTASIVLGLLFFIFFRLGVY